MRRRAILLLMTMAATLVLASGVALAINTIQCNEGGRVICWGTNESDRMLGTDEKNTMFAKGRGDILKGFDASDSLHGDRGNDELYGGSGKDTLNGGPDNDVLEAGQGHDWYDIRENEWGNDHITDTALPDNDYLTGNTIAPYPDLTTNLTIDLRSGSGPEVRNEARTSTINWSGNVIDNVSNDGGGNDEITGNDVANYILSREGADVVYAGPGDDRIYVGDGDGDDTVDCGEGSDTVENSDPGDVLANCETVPSGNP